LHVCPSENGGICNELIKQQYELISVLKEEIIRLQHELLENTRIKKKMEDELVASKNII
jgi:hypothetical protein